MINIFFWILITLLGLVAIVVVGFLVYRSDRQARNGPALEITAPNGIVDGRFVALGGIEQWISIRGEDRVNPVILVLHGGPATSYMSFTALFRAWEKHFTVVQWDRRGVGKTFGSNGRAGSGEMTLDRIVSDGIELAELLRQELGKPKIILLGHSMGSMIGVAMAARRPDPFYAYVGTEQIIDMAPNEEASYRLILEHAREQHNDMAIKRLVRIGPPPYESAARWGVKQRQAEVADPAYGAIVRQMPAFLFFSPTYRLRDVASFMGGQSFCLSALYPQWMAFKARDLGATFALPMFIIQGANDLLTPTNLAAAWLGEIDAPQKQLVAIPGGGHLVFATAADAYLEALLTLVRPLALSPNPG